MVPNVMVPNVIIPNVMSQMSSRGRRGTPTATTIPTSPSPRTRLAATPAAHTKIMFTSHASPTID